MEEISRIKGTTRFGGLIGRGLAHSLSPLIHNTSAQILGIDATYHAFDFAAAPGEAFFDLMRSGNCYGFNITLPYKESIAKLLTATRAVPLATANTLVAKGSHWDVTSTDADGFIAGLGTIDVEPPDFTAVVFLGFGGAAKALMEKFQRDWPQTLLFVLRRTPSPNEAEHWLRDVHFVDFEDAELTNILRQFPKVLLVQCTSSPLRGDKLERFLPSMALLKGAFVDLVYGSPSALLKEAELRQIPCQDGIPMLIHQALLSQKLWWGQSADFSAMKTVLARQL